VPAESMMRFMSAVRTIRPAEAKAQNTADQPARERIAAEVLVRITEGPRLRPTKCLPCRRSWVRIPSAAFRESPAPAGFFYGLGEVVSLCVGSSGRG
jgi:hypothetical protein